jgi:prephenate dehydratase
VGTYSETAALAYANSLSPQPHQLIPYPSIALALRSVVQNQADLAVVPVENSTEGSVVMTLDALWQLPGLQIQQELVLPISHALLSPQTIANRN